MAEATPAQIELHSFFHEPQIAESTQHADLLLENYAYRGCARRGPRPNFMGIKAGPQNLNVWRPEPEWTRKIRHLKIFFFF